jgi:hypothetical protein
MEFVAVVQYFSTIRRVKIMKGQASAHASYRRVGIPVGFGVIGLAAASARVSHQILKKNPIRTTRIATAITKGAINRWSAPACEIAFAITTGVCRIPRAANPNAIHLTFLRLSDFMGFLLTRIFC